MVLRLAVVFALEQCLLPHEVAMWQNFISLIPCL